MWLLVVEGIVSVFAGLGAFLIPGVTALALLYLIAAWAIGTGVIEIVEAMRLRKQIRGEWLLAASGLLSVALGIGAILFPTAGALGILLWIGAYAVMFGVVLVGLGFKLRSLTHGPGFGNLAHSH